MNPNNLQSGCGVSPQTVPGATLARHSESDDGRSESSAQDTEKSSPNLLPPQWSEATWSHKQVPQDLAQITEHCSLGTSSPHPYDDMGFVDPPEMSAEPDYDGDYDYEESARERELMLDDLADYNEDFSRSKSSSKTASFPPTPRFPAPPQGTPLSTPRSLSPAPPAARRRSGR